jgi:hypothetical protein
MLVVLQEATVARLRRYTRAFAEAEAAKGNSDAMVATNIYLTLSQLEKIDRLITQRAAEDSAKLGRKVARMTITDFFRVLVDELKEAQ